MQPTATDEAASVRQSVCLSVCTIMSPAEPIEMSFGMWARVRPMNHVLDGVHNAASWRILLNRLCAAVMPPFAKLL